MHLSKYLNQRSEKNGKFFKVVSELNQEKKHEKIEFHNSIQCLKKVLEKSMYVCWNVCYQLFS